MIKPLKMQEKGKKGRLSPVQKQKNGHNSKEKGKKALNFYYFSPLVRC